MLNTLIYKLTHLQWHNFTVITATLVTFFTAALVSFLFQYKKLGRGLSLVDFLKHCFPPQGWKSKSNRIDIVMYIAGKFIRGILSLGDVILTLALATGVSALLSHLLPGQAPLTAGYFTLLALSLLFFIFADFANFFTHFMQHKIGFLWELHKVHHSATFLTPLTTARMHPLGDKLDHVGAALMASLPMGVAMFTFGLGLPEMTVMMANANLVGTILVLDALRHSHFPVSFGKLDYLLISPHMHQLHHSARFEHWDKNMGNKLSIWDFLFGTAFIPDKTEPLSYGIGRGADLDAEYHSLHGVYIRPVISMVKVIISGPQEPPPVPTSNDLTGPIT